MAVVVEHDKRKREILENALDIFIEEGYEDATFQKIADRCGITRTTLYVYFKNKKEIFLWSIKQLTAGLEETLQEVIHNKDLNPEKKMRLMLKKIVEKCIENRRLFSVVLTYLLQLQKMGKSPSESVRRRILRLRHLMSTVIIQGINNGDFKPINVKSANELFYALIESSIFRLAILDQSNINEMITAFDIAVDGILCQK